ncbi:MAG: hypothetical protein VW397_04745, partial [Candidatus Margulisiibacteriota bacterium]
MWKILFILIASIYSVSYGLEIRDDAFHLNLTIDEELWQRVPTEKYRDRFLLRHTSLPATINIIAYRFNETITANGLVQRRIQSVYDGWQLIKMEELTLFQSKKKNITEGIRSIYRKTYLDEDLKEQQQFAGDICLVTDDTLAIVLNITMDNAATLLRVKDDFNQLYTSFWYGDEKPIVNIAISKEDQWVKDQQNLSRRRFYDSSFSITETTDVMNELEIYQDNDFKNAKLYNNENGQYILSNQILYYINAYEDEVKTIKLDLNHPQLQLTGDGFYAIQLNPFLKFKKYNLDLQPISELEDRKRALAAFALNDHFIVINDDELKLISLDQTIWKINIPLNDIQYVANLEQLIIANENNNTLLFIDLNNGEITQQVPLNAISSELTGQLIDMAMNQGKLLITMINGTDVIQSVINVETYTQEDQRIMSDIHQFKLIGISNNLIINQFKTQQG